MEQTENSHRNGVIEQQYGRIKLNNSWVGILNVCNAGRGMTLIELNHYFQQISAKVIIVGNFNAHHPLWDNRRGPCANSQSLVVAIAQGDLLLLIPQNVPPYLDSRTGRPSIWICVSYQAVYFHHRV